MPTITLTIPDPIYNALEVEGKPLDESPRDVLNHGLRLVLKAYE